MSSLRIWPRLAMFISTVALAAPLMINQAHAGPAKSGQVDPTDPTSVANAGLKTMSILVTKETYAQMGFKSLDEVGRARLGSPIAVYMVRLDELKRANQSTSPKSLMHDVKERIFPVHVGGSARTALVVSQDAKGHWKMSSLGDAATVKLLDSVRATHAKSSGKNHQYFLLRIPAIYQMFLGFTDGSGKFHLITTHEDKKLGLRRGEARPARTVLELMQKLAKSANPLGKPTK